MIRQIAPQCPSTYLVRTLACYEEKLEFCCTRKWQDPRAYAIVAQDGQAIHFRFAGPPADRPWRKRDFVGKDSDGRLLAISASPAND